MISLVDEIDHYAADLQHHHVPASRSPRYVPGLRDRVCVECHQAWPCDSARWANQWIESLTRIEAHRRRPTRRH